MVKNLLCPRCKHFGDEIEKDGFPEFMPLNCKAYPDGIPSKVYFMELDHRNPIDGDNGIKFEPKQDSN